MSRYSSANDHDVVPVSDVTDPSVLVESSNECYTPYGRPGPIVVKVPVVLADCKIQIDVERQIHLDQPAFDVKTIDKHVCITQCHLVPGTNKLFIGGYVQKNIQYSVVDHECTTATSVSGNIVHTTLNVPFRCVTAVCFEKKPIFGKSFKNRMNVLDEGMLCTDVGEDSWVHFNKPYEPIFCELEWTKIYETDIYDRTEKCARPFSAVRCFDELLEKMVVYLRIKVLQKQPVYIPEPKCEVKMEKDYDRQEEDYDDIQVGYVPDKGMVGKMMEKY